MLPDKFGLHNVPSEFYIKKDKIMEAGRIDSYLHSTGLVENKHGALVKVTCQTDFAARVFEFKEFTQRVAKLACGFQCSEWQELAIQMPAIELERVALEDTLREKVVVQHIILLGLEEA